MPCGLCGRRGTAQPLHLTHGVSVWLCPLHRERAYLERDGGRRFAERVAAVWAANGCLTVRRAGALRAHLRTVARGGTGRGCPGSYSWPLLRTRAEARFAQGDDPRAVIAELRAECSGGPARAPSVRTMRRWFADARWRLSVPDPAPIRVVRASHARMVAIVHAMQVAAPAAMRRNPFAPWFDPPAPVP